MFERMCKEAAEEVAAGKQGWRQMNANVLFMACFHLLTNHLSHKIMELKKPLWWAASTIGAAALLAVIKMLVDWVTKGG
jgi:uncharacterized membrane protein YoaK (UPF0700 family)